MIKYTRISRKGGCRRVKLIFLGDSITQGVGASDQAHSFVGIVEKETGARVLNAGMGSTRIAASDLQWDEPHWHALDFVTRAAVLPDDCDFIFVFGGTNDYGDGDAPVGDETDKGVNSAPDRLIKIPNRPARQKTTDKCADTSVPRNAAADTCRAGYDSVMQISLMSLRTMLI